MAVIASPHHDKERQALKIFNSLSEEFGHLHRIQMDDPEEVMG